MKSFLIAVRICFLSGCLQAQVKSTDVPDEVLNRWSAKLPIEKTYIHFDRENYLAGETMWFKAYLFSDFLPDTISTTLYVELVDQFSNIQYRQILPVFWGACNGQIELADSLATGIYYIRAYSRTMLNHDPGFIYRKNIFIYGKINLGEALNSPLKKTTRVEFFPEGGSLINNFVNRVAFKSTDANGVPVNVSGTIMDDNNKPLLRFRSYHDGMGMFDIMIDSNRRYFAVLEEDSTENKFYLPPQTDRGIIFKMIADSISSSFEIRQQTRDTFFRADYMIGQIQNHVVFKQNFLQNQNIIKGVIKTADLNSGILQVTVFNKAGSPLAERIIFIDNKEYIEPVKLILDTVDFSAKAKNYFSLLFSNYIKGSFSVSITDPGYSFSTSREENLFSSILLSSDLKGDVYNPGWYFSANNADSVKKGLDLVMMTNGWRRFKWSELLYADIPEKKYKKDLSYITLKGTIKNHNNQKPFAGKSFLVSIATADSANITQEIKTDNLGRFEIDSVVFFDKARILVFDFSGKENQSIEVQLTEDSITQSFMVPDIKKQGLLIRDLVTISNKSKMSLAFDAILQARGKVLENVNVKSRQKRPIEILEEKYASPLFQTTAEKTIDLVNTNENIFQTNILDYLQSRVAGLDIVKLKPFDYRTYYRKKPMTTFYLNEQPCTLDNIISVPADQVAMVKVFSHFIGAEFNGYGGVLAVYTKKGADFGKLSSSEFHPITYHGYSITKEFYSPDYGDKSASVKSDNRITLHWIPNITVNGGELKIPFSFYNNDRTQQFKIVVEGVTNSGKMTVIEKIISSNEFK